MIVFVFDAGPEEKVAVLLGAGKRSVPAPILRPWPWESAASAIRSTAMGRWGPLTPPRARHFILVLLILAWSKADEG